MLALSNRLGGGRAAAERSVPCNVSIHRYTYLNVITDKIRTIETDALPIRVNTIEWFVRTIVRLYVKNEISSKTLGGGGGGVSSHGETLEGPSAPLRWG